MIKRNAAIFLLAITMGARASVTIDFTGTSEYRAVKWTLSNLNDNPPAISGLNSPTAANAFTGAGTFGGGTVSLRFSAGTDWNATTAQNAINNHTFGDYLSGFTNGGISAVAGAFGVYDGTDADTGDTTFDEQGEVMLIQIGVNGIYVPLSLERLGFNKMSPADRTDFIIYDASSNTVKEVQWNRNYDGDDFVSGNWPLENGDYIVLAVGEGNSSEEWRLADITVDIPNDPGDGRVGGLSATAANTEIQLDWYDFTFSELAYYNLYRSTMSGSNYDRIATGLTTHSYVDRSVTNGITYYYAATAVDAGGDETVFSDEVSETPVVPVPENVTVLFGDGRVDLDWDDSFDTLFSGFSVYRSTTLGTNYALIAEGVAESQFADTTVDNDTTYYYVIRHADALGNESGNSAEVEALPSADLIIVNLDSKLQGEARVVPAADGKYETAGSKVNLNGMKAGEYMNGQLARPILKFPLKLNDLGDKTTNDIDRVVLRMYLNENILYTSPTTELEVFASQVEAVDSAITADDFENPNYTKVGTWDSIDEASPIFAWYDVDVTDAVLNDLASDPLDTSAGSCFRLQLSGDTSLISTNNSIPDYSGLVVARFDGNSSDNRPQLRIKWKTLWTDIGGMFEDADDDGVNNLLEYAFNGNPTSSADCGFFPILSVTDSGIDYIHVQRVNDSNLVYQLETSTNLVTGPWTNVNYSISGTGFQDDEFRTVTNAVPGDHSTCYLRMNVEYN